MRAEWRVNQVARLEGDGIELSGAPVTPEMAAQ